MKIKMPDKTASFQQQIQIQRTIVAMLMAVALFLSGCSRGPEIVLRQSKVELDTGFVKIVCQGNNELVEGQVINIKSFTAPKGAKKI